MLDSDPAAIPASRRRATLAWLAIALIVAAVALAFAWVGGWLGSGRLTSQRFTNAIETANGQVWRGFRRAHAKGVCVAGYFEGNGRSEEHTSELQSRRDLVCRLLLEKKKVSLVRLLLGS